MEKTGTRKSSKAAQQSKIRVAVADDSPEYAQMLVSAFARKGNFDVVGTATNGEAICKMVREKSPDVVTMDIIMPLRDGLSAMDCILKDRLIQRKPLFVVVSAVGKDSVAQEAFLHGAEYYYRKPADVDEVANTISRLAALRVQAGAERIPGTGTGERVNLIQEQKMLYTTGDPVRDISDILQELGISAHLMGYRYLRDSILIAMDNPGNVSEVTHLIYEPVAAKWKTTAGKVERAIRHALEVGWEKGNSLTQHQYFGTRMSKEGNRPTVSEFIATVADKLTIEYKIALSKR